MALLKKHIRLPAVVVLLLILFGLSLASAREEELVIDNPEAYGGKHRAAITFPHELHVGSLECLACHHDYKDGENILSEDNLKEENPDILCAACHDADAEIRLKKAYHRQCMGCHRFVRLTGSATGPELCGECHIKRIKSESP